MSTHYEVLSLPRSGALTPQLTKAAYRRALLQHHPDKNSSVTTPKPSPSTPTYSIDQITLAYQTLSSPSSKSSYDRDLALSPNCNSQSASQTAAGGKDGSIFRTGVEVLDLDDLECEEDSETGEMVWWRGCRCGDERGFLVREGELEEASRDGEGEVVAGCGGCSLWVRVGFGVVEGEVEEGKGGKKE